MKLTIIKSLVILLAFSLVLSYTIKERTAGNPLFGFTGMCHNRESIMNKILPQKTFKKGTILRTLFEKVIKPLTNVVDQFEPSGCIGDFTGKKLAENEFAQNANCDSFPLAEKEKISAISFSVDNVPCVVPVSVNFCTIFDKGGNFGFSISGGAIACFTAATGVGAVLSPIANGADFLQFGYSPDRKWTKKMSFIDGKDINPHQKEFTLKSHVYLGGSLAVPDFKVKVGDFDLNDILSGSLIGTFNFDYGKNNPFSIENLKKLFSEKTTKKNAMQKIRTFILPAREASFSVTASLTFDLKKLTRGFLNELEIKGAKIDMMFSIPGPNGDNGSTGLPAGLYMTLKPPKDFIGQFLQPFIDKFNEKIKILKINVKFPTLENTIVTFYFGTSIQFKIKFPAFSLRCLFHLKKFEVQCKTQGKIIDFIEEKGKILVKEIKDRAKSFFAKIKSLS
jgi:hypothetical protein